MKKYNNENNQDSSSVIIIENGKITFSPKSFETLVNLCKSQFTVLFVDEKEKFIDISNWDGVIDKNILQYFGYSNVAAQYVYNKIRFNWIEADSKAA